MQLSRELYVQYKTAWVLSHKIRESLLDDTNDEMLTGICEIDGVYAGGKTRQINTISDRVAGYHVGVIYNLGFFIINPSVFIRYNTLTKPFYKG